MRRTFHPSPSPDSLTAGTEALVRDFVDSSGGVLIVMGDGTGLRLLDSLWGYTVGSGNTPGSALALNTGAASGTPFAGGPAQLWENDNLFTTDGSTYPAAAKLIYAAGTDVALAVIPQGRGAVAVVAWDWDSASPHGPQDGGWIEALRRILRL